MKRVIVLSWFKKITNRLFGSDEVDDQENVNYENFESESEDSLHKLDRKNSASFRFPIISDAEIYGWDDGPTKERENHKIISPTEKEEDSNYETKPLFENDKWPSDTRPVNVYRSASALKYGKKKEVEKTPFSTPKKTKPDKLPSRVSTTVQKRSNKPFTPTAVPSPIYGYTNPRREETKKIIIAEDIKQAPLHSGDENFAIEPKLPMNEMHLHELDGLSVIPLEIEVAPVETEIIEVNTQEEFFKTESSIVENVILEAVVEVTEFPEAEVVEIESTLVKEDFAGIFSDSPEHTNNKVTETETETETETIQYLNTEVLTEEQYPEKRKERIVPFNVLMLKSDKEKIKSVIADFPETVIKNETLVKKDVKINEPLLDPQEKSVNDQNKIDSDSIEEEEPYYAFPPLHYLIPPEAQIEDTDWLESQSEKLEEALSHFAVKATVIEAMQGPTVTRFELTVGVGTKVSKVRNLTDDLKLALAAEDIRIQAPIPGRSSIGIEIPNRKTRAVRISEVIATDQFRTSSSPLEAVLGLSLTGTPVTLDLRKMPHGMIAGATGSGKSVCINSILVSLLYKATPTDLKMMLIDPKMVELAPFNGIPHLISPVITDVKAATAALKWAVAEMERRYELLAHAGVRDIERYNKAVVESRRFSLKMPYLLIVIDELADLMMMAPADVEVSISRIAQKARACGIHLIIATQRPSVDVITGTIKANIPTRIAFSVSSQIDSRTIIDSPGAERLLGKGDMLYIGNGQSSNVRLQGTFVTDEEIERIIEHVQNEASPEYLFGQDDLLASSIEEEGADSLFEEACLFIHETGSASTSLLQRNFSIGYNRAAKLIDRMEKNGFISGQRGSKARDVFLTESDLDRLTDRLE